VRYKILFPGRYKHCGMDYWTGILNWNTELEYWTDIFLVFTNVVVG